MSATMSVYDASTEWASLGRNPVNSSELDPMITELTAPLIGTRPIMSTFGYWADNQAVGFDLTDYEYIGMVIDYGMITITEDTSYEFDIDSDDYGELWVNGILVAYEAVDLCTTIPIALTPGSYSFVFKFQNGTGSYSFALRWRKQGETSYYPIDNVSLGLVLDNQPESFTPSELIYDFVDYPHKLTVKTELDGEAVQRRVMISNRATGAYVASMISDENGVAAFTRLPPQAIDEPYVVICFDDRTTGFLNAIVYDRVYQITNQGAPPEN